MTNITEITKQFVSDKNANAPVSSNESSISSNPSTEVKVGVEASSVNLSDAVSQAVEAGSFDEVKVAALRAAIMDGNYPLDAKRIAENMATLERLIG
ncbi:flagellar biosynthesis anti-sigma factor FlgM [Luminiphilus sp.]|jgi:negative regulator of flagellin synthesis FlgM|nr:flagellar biosynthesis anti-sigma factor FlgM [Luminiphilus sp.]